VSVIGVGLLAVVVVAQTVGGWLGIA
jgi:hypothetical protein